MLHPPVFALLDDRLAPDILEHLEACPSCRRLAAHARPVTRAQEPRPDLETLQPVDAEHYVVEPGSEVRGGMGRTYVARDRRLGRDVAIKQPLDPVELGDPSLWATLRARFEREARLTARLEHPAIVGVYEAGRFGDGQPFYAMRLVRGSTLGAEIAARATLVQRIALLPNLTIIAEALAYAHSRGVTHRDVKPDNVLIGKFGETVLIDWGLAAETHEASRASRDSEVPLTEYGVGTRGYMAPEQASGEAAAAPADVYALGATLHHLLAGSAPAARPLAEVCPEAPRALATVIARAMSPRPADRPTAAELVEELRRFQTGRLIESHRYSPRELIGHYARRFRTPLAIAAVSLVGLAVITVVYVRGLSRETARADASNERAQAALRQQLGVTASQLARDPVRRLDALADGVRAVAPALARHEAPAPEAWQGLLDALAAAPAGTSLVGHRGVVTSFAVTARGDRVVTAGSDHTARTWELPTGRAIASYPCTLERPLTVQLSPDERVALICGYDARGELVPLDGAAAHSIELAAGDARCGFTPQGHAVIAAGAELRTFDALTGAVIARAALPSHATALAVAANGQLAIGVQSGEVFAWREGGSLESGGDGHPGGVRGAAFVDADARLVTAGVDGRLLSWRMDGDRPSSPRLVHAGDPVQALVPTPDGVALLSAYGRNDLNVMTTTLVRADGTTTIPELSLKGASASELVGMTREHARLVDPRTGHDLLRLPRMAELVHGAARAGELAIVISVDGAAIAWDLRHTLASGMLIGHSSEITGIAAAGGALWTASLDGSLRRWSAPPLVLAGNDELLALTASPDHSTVIATTNGGEVRVHDHDGTLRATLSLPHTALRVAAVSPDGSRVITNGPAGRAQIWELAGQPVAELELANAAARVTAIAWTADGAIVVGADDGSVTRFEPDGRRTATAVVFEGPTREAVDRLEASGTAVAAGAANTQLAVLDARSLAARARLPAHLGALAGTVAVGFAADGGVQLVPLAGGAPRLLDGHLRPVLVAAATGTHLATADLGGTVRIWDLATGRSIATFAISEVGTPTAIAFVDDTTVAIGGATGLVRTMPLDPSAAVARACDVLRYFGRADACD